MSQNSESTTHTDSCSLYRRAVDPSASSEKSSAPKEVEAPKPDTSKVKPKETVVVKEEPQTPLKQKEKSKSVSCCLLVA